MTEGGEKSEPDGHRINHLGDAERPNEPGCQFSTQESLWLQELGLDDFRQRSILPRSWLARLYCPLV